MREITDIERYVEAQDTPYADYQLALSEIASGRKLSHWIWYIFPQLRGLGQSGRSYYYGIADKTEAEAYLNHPVLSLRLREISDELLAHTNKSAEYIFGGIDAAKVKSCMTLFDCISPNDIFSDVLDSFYDGERDKNSFI